MSEKNQTFFRKKSELSEKKMNLEIFCCQPMKNVGKLAALLLLSRFSASLVFTFCSSQVPKVEKTNCFAAIFKLSRGFSPILTNFEQAALLLLSRFSASLFFTFCSSQVPKVEKTNCFAAIFKLSRWLSPILTNFKYFSEKFHNFFRKFQKKNQNFLKKIWKFSEKIWNMSEKNLKKSEKHWKNLKNLAWLMFTFFSKNWFTNNSHFSEKIKTLIYRTLLDWKLSKLEICLASLLTDFLLATNLLQVIYI